MSRKPNPPPDDKEQAQRFVETAKTLRSDESGKQFEAAVKVVVPPRQNVAEPKNKPNK